MRSINLLRVSCVMTVVACFVAGSVALAARGVDQDSSATQAPPDLRPGEIIIKVTGHKRITRAAVPAPAKPTTEPVADLSYDGPGPRSVTIGYFRRDPLETGWGPQVYEPAYYDAGYGYSSYGGYGYSSGSYCYTPSYSYPRSSCYTSSYGFTPSYCGTRSFFGSSSYCGRSTSFSTTHMGRR
jgi:hypothetical protein